MNKFQITRRWLLIGLFLALALFTVATAQPTLAQDRAANGTVNTGATYDGKTGETLFKTPFPRTTRHEFPAGRGLMVQGGQVTKVQVALPE